METKVTYPLHDKKPSFFLLDKLYIYPLRGRYLT